MNKGLKIDLGCGYAKQPGFYGIDKRALSTVDLVQDLEDTPWNLDSDVANTILCSHVLEHIDPRNFLQVLAEIHRIGMHGCQVFISTPYAGSFGAYQDPTHTRPGFNEGVALYFDPRPCEHQYNPLYEIYQPPPFQSHKVVWEPHGNLEMIWIVMKDEQWLAESRARNATYKR